MLGFGMVQYLELEALSYALSGSLLSHQQGRLMRKAVLRETR